MIRLKIWVYQNNRWDITPWWRNVIHEVDSLVPNAINDINQDVWDTVIQLELEKYNAKYVKSRTFSKSFIEFADERMVNYHALKEVACKSHILTGSHLTNSKGWHGLPVMVSS